MNANKGVCSNEYQDESSESRNKGRRGLLDARSRCGFLCWEKCVTTRVRRPLAVKCPVFHPFHESEGDCHVPMGNRLDGRRSGAVPRACQPHPRGREEGGRQEGRYEGSPT